MFQKVGLRDIFIGLWDRRIKIIIIAVLAVALAGINVLFSIDGNIGSSSSETIYSKVITFYVSSAEESEYIDTYDQANKIRNIIISTLNSELFADYLQKNIQSEKQLSEYLYTVDGKDVSILTPDKNILNICESLKIENGGDNATIKFSFNCTDNSIGDDIINATSKFINEEIVGNLKNAEISETGRTSFETEKVVNISQKSRKTVVIELIKKVIIYAVVLELVYGCASLAVMMFNPVINRKSDIEEYTDSGIWEV